jgi:hypothetical protein
MPATNRQDEDQTHYQQHLTVWQWSTLADLGFLISIAITALLGAVLWLLG